MVQRIPLGGKHGVGKFAIVDDDDYEWLTQWSWYGHQGGYAVRHLHNPNENRALFMHRAILERMGHNLSGLQGDHIDRDRLNNRRANLRPATHSENRRNQGKSLKPTSSRYKGVTWAKERKKWLASIRIDGSNKNLGYHVNEDDAARAYNAAALKAWGEYAGLNDVPVIQLELPLKK